jgi:hypothetical protein
MDGTTTLLAAGLSGVAGLLASYFGIRWQIRKDLEAKYDASLRELRLKAYGPLWSLTKPLALFARGTYPTQKQLEALAVSLRDWYFDSGGLYMSEGARDAYFRLQRALRALASSNRWRDDRLHEIDPDTFEYLRRIGSRLRTMLTLDVGTRNPFAFDSKAQATDAAGPSRDEPDDTDEGPILRAWSRQSENHGTASPPT